MLDQNPIVLVDKVLSHSCNTRSNPLPSVLVPGGNFHIRKNTDRRQWAWFLLFDARILGR
tara:strand:- start:13597 stop:13776 length:180 start_codon:yes stop_codon:yes gene_type:complete